MVIWLLGSSHCLFLSCKHACWHPSCLQNSFAFGMRGHFQLSVPREPVWLTGRKMGGYMEKPALQNEFFTEAKPSTACTIAFVSRDETPDVTQGRVLSKTHSGTLPVPAPLENSLLGPVCLVPTLSKPLAPGTDRWLAGYPRAGSSRLGAGGSPSPHALVGVLAEDVLDDDDGLLHHVVDLGLDEVQQGADAALRRLLLGGVRSAMPSHPHHTPACPQAQRGAEGTHTQLLPPLFCAPNPKPEGLGRAP